MEGFKSPRWTLIEDVRLARLLNQGKSNQDIHAILFENTDRNRRSIQRRSRRHCKAKKCLRCGARLRGPAPQKGYRGTYSRRGGVCKACMGPRFEAALVTEKARERKRHWDEDQESFLQFYKTQRRKRLRRLLEPQR